MIMEELKWKARGWSEVHSSELLIRGGSNVWSDIFGKVKSIINFLADYIPKLFSGILDGFAAF